MKNIYILCLPVPFPGRGWQSLGAFASVESAQEFAESRLQWFRETDPKWAELGPPTLTWERLSPTHWNTGSGEFFIERVVWEPEL